MKQYFSVFALVIFGGATAMASSNAIEKKESCPQSFTLDQARKLSEGAEVIDGRIFAPVDHNDFNKNFTKSWQILSNWKFSPKLVEEEGDGDKKLTCHYEYTTLAGHTYKLVIYKRKELPRTLLYR